MNSKNTKEIEFNDLLFRALEHAVNSITDGEILFPFVMTPTNVQRFVSDRIENGKEQAEKYIEDQKTEPLLCLAYDGFVTLEAIKEDAVFVVGIDRDRGKKIIMAQRYKPKSDLSKLTVVGNPILVEEQELKTKE
ncbi:MAG: hypothetical protein NT098_00505 [Candidatus Parcubacteria bacterium]|nr:hypothetical protein [Candidatus Parcubacteria bacterium]